MEKVRAIVIRQHGNPAEVARLESVDSKHPLEHEAKVRILFAPINPADINMLEGKYPIRPILPGFPGGEGVGIIDYVGPNSHNLALGSPVLLPAGIGSWRASANIATANLIRIPISIPLKQAAMARINPATALRMLRDFVTLKRGDWIVQNAANSGVGRAVIQLAKDAGLRTINAVRRPELIEELKALGADEVFLDDDDFINKTATATGKSSPRLALNAVGGDSAVRLARTLHSGSTIVTYGAMGRNPLRIPNGLVIFKDLIWRGFWVSRWYETATAEQHTAMFTELFDHLSRGKLHTPIDAIYPLDKISEALTHAQQGGRSGKILLECNS